MSLLLVCSVGGTPQPIVAAIQQYQPARVILWHTADSRKAADQAVLDSNVVAGCVDYRLVRDEQDFASCVSDARKLRTDFDQWKDRSDSHDVIVDFTGGTKLMSAALALVTHRWNCRFSYVGGSQRTKEGVGIVVDGSEKPIRSDNPLDALAYQPVFDAIQLFNAGLPAAAERLLDPVIRRSDLEPSVKRSVVAVKHVLSAYAKWDAFQHSDAATFFDNALKTLNDLAAMLSIAGLQQTLQKDKQTCEELKATGAKPTQALVVDLVANAERRAKLGQYDDAVARLYRAIEAFAQAELAALDIDTGNVKVDQIQQNVRDTLHAKPETGIYKLGLQDAYLLLRSLKPESAASFFEGKLDADTSPLTARNQSILAHGFSPISEKPYSALKDVVDKLLPPGTRRLFPQLPSP
jgi:CRISPR-associated protein (TIGR02710 family)